MYKKGAGNDKQGKDAGNRTLCPYRNFSQAIISVTISLRRCINCPTVHGINFNLIRIKPYTDELILWYKHFVVICCFLAAKSQRIEKTILYSL